MIIDNVSKSQVRLIAEADFMQMVVFLLARMDDKDFDDNLFTPIHKLAIDDKYLEKTEVGSEPANV